MLKRFMAWLDAKLVNLFAGPCDHCFLPVKGKHGEYIGQQCPICDHFNPIEEVMKK